MTKGVDDKTAKVWEVASGRLLHSLEGHIDLMHSTRFSPDGTRLVTVVWTRQRRCGRFPVGACSLP